MINPYFDGWVKIIQGDALKVLAEMPEESVQMVITSPPYWGLRKYSGEQEMVWGDDHCEHRWANEVIGKKTNYNEGFNTRWEGSPNPIQKNSEMGKVGRFERQTCSLCGAWRGAYGLEPTPEMYVQHTIEFLRAIRRVLRKDGVVFWDIGDSYMSHGGDRAKVGGFQANPSKDRLEAESSMSMIKRTTNILKDKDLCLIPFRVAIAAQEDGWFVRSVIIWSKLNPMPESCKDRPTESHEYILLLTKSAHYYWDMEAVREKLDYGADSSRAWASNNPERRKDDTGIGKGITTTRQDEFYAKVRAGKIIGRNLRSVWTFATEPYPEAHFATFPRELPKRCILAATSEKGNCSKCGKPWGRMLKENKSYWSAHKEERFMGKGNNLDRHDNYTLSGPALKRWKDEHPSETLGWRPSCACGIEETTPALVLDPFAGSGTVGEVAKSLGRKAILIDTSAEYCSLAQKRVEAISLPLKGIEC